MPIDLTKAIEHECPSVRCDGTVYLAKFNSYGYAVGSFSREWYGLNFSGSPVGNWNGVQFDAPGWNSSSWEYLWEIVDVCTSQALSETLDREDNTSVHIELSESILTEAFTWLDNLGFISLPDDNEDIEWLRVLAKRFLKEKKEDA